MRARAPVECECYIYIFSVILKKQIVYTLFLECLQTVIKCLHILDAIKILKPKFSINTFLMRVLFVCVWVFFIFKGGLSSIFCFSLYRGPI